MSKQFFPIIIHPESDGYSVFVPDLPGCNTQGDTLEEAYSMVFDAIGTYLEGVEEKDYPVKSKPEDIELEKGEYIGFVYFNMLDFQKKNNSKPVNKTLTIPAWLNDLGKKENVNFSGVLKDALMAKLNVQ